MSGERGIYTREENMNMSAVTVLRPLTRNEKTGCVVIRLFSAYTFRCLCIHCPEVMLVSALFSAVPILLFGVGIFYLFRLRFFYVLHPIRCFRLLFSGERRGGISPFRALTVALAGTLGVGNIVGVASALCLGGAGAVFWMLVSALVAMVLKYAEITLALRHRPAPTRDGQPTGGAPYYMEAGLSGRGLPKAGKICGGIFAVLCLLNAVTMGSFLQVNAVAGAMETGFSLPPLWVGIAVTAVALLATLGGAKGISAVTEKLVPFMTVGFLILCVAVLFLRRERIPDALSSILRDAFTPAAAGGGIVGFLTSAGVRMGVMRGLVSNEAGCGTAPAAHATAEVDLPARQGLFGLVEVFVDTVLLCTVTALAILVSDSGAPLGETNAVAVASDAFSSVLGDFAGWFFSLSILLFGVATVICWAHYGKTCLSYLTARLSPTARRTITGIYSVLFALSPLAGAMASPTLAWTLADVAIALMTLLNLGVLLLMAGEVKEETDILLGQKR